MQIKDTVKWRTRLGYPTKGKIIEICDDYIVVEALDNFKSSTRRTSASSKYNKAKYKIKYSNILEVNGEAYGSVN